MAYSNLEKALDRISQGKVDTGEDMMLSANLALLLFESPVLDRVICEDYPYTPELKAILEEQCMKLGLDADKMEKELQQAIDADGFLIYKDMSPKGQVINYMATQKLGPVAWSMFNALKLGQDLTDEQAALLQKVCKKLEHEDWYEAILEDLRASRYV